MLFSGEVSLVHRMSLWAFDVAVGVTILSSAAARGLRDSRIFLNIEATSPSDLLVLLIRPIEIDCNGAGGAGGRGSGWTSQFCKSSPYL